MPSRNVQDAMDAVIKILDAKPQRAQASLDAERAAEARWLGHWRLVQLGVTFKVTAVREDRVYCRSVDKGDTIIKVGDMDFLAASGELQFLGK